ncbi:DNA polymerase III subunit delta' [Aestuariivirga sp.]|uniref:DNA polymerase III subunit delta' n=1 Tax=Aestuariivirga sp. TaxID=2650926 RepID=UPI0039E3271F
MAEDFKDPRDVEWHPRRRLSLVGHENAEQKLLKVHQSDRLHHAWLLAGNKGIGKATLAYRFARFLLARPDDRRDGLNVDAGSQAAHWIATGAHPDLLVIERGVDFKAKKIKTGIAVDDARIVPEFFARTSAGGGYRVAVVDATDDLNAPSANALLKIIEEPPEKSVFLLVSHNPGALLRTIRSRCIRLDMQPLTEGETLSVLQDLPPVAGEPEDKLRQAASLSQGSPGRAFDLVGSKGAQIFSRLQSNMRFPPAKVAEIALSFGARETAEDFAVFCDLFVNWMGEQARARALGGGGAEMAKAHDEIVYSLRQADALNLDRRQTVADALLKLDEALKAS